MKKRESGTSPANLMKWWRKAVLAVWGDRCVWCGRKPVECHHIVRRGKAVLRYDWRNGIPLCATCHAEADTASGRRRVYGDSARFSWGSERADSISVQSAPVPPNAATRRLNAL